MPAIGPGFPLAKGWPGRCRDTALRATVNALFRRGLPALNAARATRQLAAALVLRPGARYRPDPRAVQRIFDFASPAVPANVSYTGAILDEPEWAEPWNGPSPQNLADPLVLVGFSSTYQQQAPLLQQVVDGLSSLPVRDRHPWAHASTRRRAPCSQRRGRTVGAARTDPPRRIAGDHPLRARHGHEGTRPRRADGVHTDGPRSERHRRPRRPSRGRHWLSPRSSATPSPRRRERC